MKAEKDNQADGQNKPVKRGKIKLKRKVNLTSKAHPGDETNPQEDVVDKQAQEQRPRKPVFSNEAVFEDDEKKKNARKHFKKPVQRDRNDRRPTGQGQQQGQGSSQQRPRPQGQGGSAAGSSRGPARGSSQVQDRNKDKASDKPKIVVQEGPAFADDASKKPSKKLKGKDKDKEKSNRKFEKTEKVQEKEFFSLKKRSTYRAPEAPVKKEASTPDKVDITESVSVGELAKKLNIKANELIAKLIKLGVMATINQVLDAETAEILCSEYGTDVNVISLYDETVIKEEDVDKPEDNVSRPPIVTVMGHVDHGKTKLLDAIRSTHVVDGEFGGITQHIGAYQVDVHGQPVTFLDTPGHEAFTTMRARGASVTDIVILVVAANDGVMPQTIEAIHHAKEAKVPIIVAINKIDLADANLEKVKQELLAHELVPEEWGGDTLFVEISAKQKINIDKLLEAILIQSEVLELKANPTVNARGTVIESKLDPGRGAVATILVQNGALHVGDPFVVGIHAGKVRAMFDDLGKPIKVAGPSTPVEVLGMDGIAGAGDPIQGVNFDKYAKQIAQKRKELKRIESAKKVKKVSLEDLNDMIKDGQVHEVKVIIKGDVDGSVQALKDALEKLSTSEVRVNVIHCAAGGINESDVMLASASNALIIGFHVRPNSNIMDLAQREKVSIKTYNIIFEVTNDVKSAMEGMLSPDIKEEILGSGEIKQVFKITKVGTIAGVVVLSGKIKKDSKVRLIRDEIVIHDGPLSSLKHYKEDVSVAEAGQECGFGFKNFNDLKVGDTFEAYQLVEIAKKLEDSK